MSTWFLYPNTDTAISICRLWSVPREASGRRPRLIVQRPSRSIWARRAGFQLDGLPPPLRVSFSVGQARSSRLDHRGIDDLPAYRQPAFRLQQRIEQGKQSFRRTGPRELLAIEPDRLGVGDRVVQCQPDKPHERQPVLQLIFGLVVRQCVQRLQYHNLEHQHRVIGRSAAPCSSQGQAFSRSDRDSAASRSPRNTSKSITCASRSNGSPAADNAFRRSSPSKKPGCPATADPPYPPSWIGYSLRKCQWFLEPSNSAQPCSDRSTVGTSAVCGAYGVAFRGSGWWDQSGWMTPTKINR